MIQIDKLMFGYGGRRVYDGLNTHFKKGAVYGLLGKNGAGKTTLMRLIAGLMDCDSGTIRVNGREPYKRDRKFLNQLYFVPESFNTPDIRVTDYANGYGIFYSGYDRKALLEYLKEMEVNPNERLGRLSFGQRKKAIIAFALSLNTSLLLLDEPGNGLDIPSKLSLRRILSEYSGPERTVILSTHQVRDIEDVADHVAIIDNGRLMLNESIQSLERRLLFVKSARIMDDSLFSERVANGYVNIVKRHIHDKNEQRGDNDSRTDVDMEILFDACTIGGWSFIQQLDSSNTNKEKEVDYAL